MRRRIPEIKNYLLVTIVALTLSACGATLTYRDIQRDFNLAVQSDNVQFTQPAPDNTAFYEQIARDLSDDNYRFIKEELDKELRSNAYIILAISQWRSGQLSEAKKTIDEAKNESLQFAPRDKIIFEIIPSLVDEQDLMNKYKKDEKGRVLKNVYADNYEKNFSFMAGKLGEVTRMVSKDTPAEIILYVHYQRWRVLNNWNIVISNIWDGQDVDSSASSELRREARKNAKDELNGVALRDEIKNELQTIPENHPLRQLAEFKSRL